MTARALHVCADVATEDGVQRWPRSRAAPDTVRRVAGICARAGITDQRTLCGAEATRAALVAGLRAPSDGLRVLTFSGHTRRGQGPIETTRWCLYDGGMELAEVAEHLAALPPTARLLIVVDSCYATAIVSCFRGPQAATVIAGCGDDQTMLERVSSEFVVRLENVLSSDPHASLDEVRAALVADTPDAERPCLWTTLADGATPLLGPAC